MDNVIVGISKFVQGKPIDKSDKDAILASCQATASEIQKVYEILLEYYWKNIDVAILHVRRRLSRHLLVYAVGHVTVDRELWVTVSQSSTNELWIYSSTKSQCVTGSGD